ncbi:hypothetical protein CAL7716_001370 [Calothrix sp. PCC 7716]|nr:hypothetical protein CAL7716_001370 [Calothrix sp. PCC 7716]
MISQISKYEKKFEFYVFFLTDLINCFILSLPHPDSKIIIYHLVESIQKELQDTEYYLHIAYINILHACANIISYPEFYRVWNRISIYS